MIRFIDLGKQIGVDDETWFRQFAFFNTVPNRFIEYNSTQVWECWKDFETDYKASLTEFPLERFKNLVPDWVFEEPE